MRRRINCYFESAFWKTFSATHCQLAVELMDRLLGGLIGGLLVQHGEFVIHHLLILVCDNTKTQAISAVFMVWAGIR